MSNLQILHYNLIHNLSPALVVCQLFFLHYLDQNCNKEIYYMFLLKSIPCLYNIFNTCPSSSFGNFIIILLNTIKTLIFMRIMPLIHKATKFYPFTDTKIIIYNITFCKENYFNLHNVSIKLIVITSPQLKIFRTSKY